MRRPDRTTRPRTVAPWALALLAAGCIQQDPQSAPPPTAPESRIELRLIGGLPLVEGRLPGDVTAWFLIDTGAGDFTLLDQNLSSSLGLKHEIVRDPLMPSIHYSAKVPFLEVDSMGRRDFTAYVAEGLSERAELADLGVTVRGVLGTGWFRDHCLWFDWGRGEFTAEHARLPLARHIALPLRFGISGELHVTVVVNGVACDALVDTGSPETLLSRETAERLKVRFDAAKLGLHRETAVGVGAVRDGVAERVEFGTAELRDVLLLVVERRIPGADLVLGTDLLSHWGVILDLAPKPYLVLDPFHGKAGPERRAPIPAPEGAPGNSGGAP